MKEFTKADILNGHIIELRDKTIMAVLRIRREFIAVNKSTMLEYVSITEDYNDDLTCVDDMVEIDIITVFDNNMSLVWRRPKN